MRLRWVAALAAIAIAGCGGSGTREHASTPCLRPGNHWFGDDLLHVPPGAAGRRPLVIAFHGGGQTGASFADYTGLSSFADRHGFAVLYQTAAAERRFWSLNRRARPDDVPHLSALSRATHAACADPSRIYAVGFSNGGGFAVRAVCELPGRFAAVAAVAGGYIKLDPCPADRRISLLEIHSDKDDGVPYHGYGREHRGDIRRFVDGWARRDGCRTPPRAAPLGRYARRLTYPGCAPGLRVEHIVVLGDPHYWYEGSNTRVWRFLRRTARQAQR